jgi:chromosome segregation ATPase
MLAVLFLATSVHAEKVSVLTELEMLQEKLWYLQRDVGANKAALAEQQKQLKGLAAGLGKERQQLNERLTSLDQAKAEQQALNARIDTLSKSNAQQQERLNLVESGLVKLGEALTSLTAEVKQQGEPLAEQSARLGALGKRMETLQGELNAQQSGAGLGLGELRGQLDEARAQIIETRSRIDALEQNVGGQIKQLGYWGAGAALVLCILLTFVIALRKDNRNRRY